MRHYLGIFALICAFSVSVAAHADTTFNLIGATFADGATATGTVTIDTIGGTFTGVDIKYVDGGTTDFFTTFLGQSTFDGGTQYFFDSPDAASDILNFDLPASGASGNLVGYTGSMLCTDSFACGDTGYFQAAGGAINEASGGSLVLAVTPEPSSLVLLGTGALGLLGATWRKFRNA